jgi:drug/metabolite transporter (DMT)-like permease
MTAPLSVHPCPTPPTDPVTPRAWLLFAVCAAVWGVPYLFIKVAVDAGLSPAFVAWARIALAALLWWCRWPCAAARYAD